MLAKNALESFKIEVNYFLNGERLMLSAFEGIGVEDIVPGVKQRRVQGLVGGVWCDSVGQGHSLYE